MTKQSSKNSDLQNFFIIFPGLLCLITILLAMTKNRSTQQRLLAMTKFIVIEQCKLKILTTNAKY
ncbi:hypothetical protein A1C_05600 [Rickettsia akari str. Hartford]|uniref:Uncharacterized protein n=2 Tax=Rickettsia akari TaxID=786 RepID=A8GPN0_RICAH|nr:hypothetical protein A1C_05600 [Rickettsia akari str. Hartford]QKR71872.1 hypothetical protein [Rickettsia akari]QKR71880.1 hypothetical protein [Rickettsia akari]QKR71884.1 hypothetical protein [Rickettsia akari]QKR71888.1 hypothetical protein [Rickettsia akari]